MGYRITLRPTDYFRAGKHYSTAGVVTASEKLALRFVCTPSHPLVPASSLSHHPNYSYPPRSLETRKFPLIMRPRCLLVIFCLLAVMLINVFSYSVSLQLVPHMVSLSFCFFAKAFFKYYNVEAFTHYSSKVLLARLMDAYARFCANCFIQGTKYTIICYSVYG